MNETGWEEKTFQCKIASLLGVLIIGKQKKRPFEFFEVCRSARWYLSIQTKNPNLVILWRALE
jgi:hypothetical protein